MDRLFKYSLASEGNAAWLLRAVAQPSEAAQLRQVSGARELCNVKVTNALYVQN